MNTPEGYSTLTPVVISRNAQATIDAYTKALGVEIDGILHCPKTGKVAHACLKTGGSSLFVSDQFPELNMSVTGHQEFYLYVGNADQAFEEAKDAGWAAGDL